MPIVLALVFAGLTAACSPTAPTPSPRVEPYVTNWPARANPPGVSLKGRWEGEATFVGCRGSCKLFPRPEVIRLTLDQANSDVTGSMQFLGWDMAFNGSITGMSGLAGRASGAGASFDIRLDLAGSRLAGFVASGSFEDPNLRVTARYNVTVPLSLVVAGAR